MEGLGELNSFVDSECLVRDSEGTSRILAMLSHLGPLYESEK